MPTLEFEEEARKDGHRWVAGIDEAGRGPLAGPVSAAAVILPEGYECPMLDDSKKLSEKKREALYETLTQDAGVRWCLSFGEVEEIEKINILRATHATMARAAKGLKQRPDFCLIDGLDVPKFPLPSRGIVKGDGLSLSIAAASIIAKVSRDRLMLKYAEEFPEYGFEKHKGYGTKKHLEALHRHGPCRIHRKTFQPIAKLLLPIEGK
jgi:ribonuclease HII